MKVDKYSDLYDELLNIDNEIKHTYENLVINNDNGNKINDIEKDNSNNSLLDESLSYTSQNNISNNININNNIILKIIEKI